jgi:hypothetical protein
MTNDILRTDIELATRLMEEKRPAEEIIAALIPRGIDRAKATQLVDDLRNGKKIDDLATLPMELGLARRSRSRSGSREGKQDHPSHSSQTESHREPSRRVASHSHKKSAGRWLIPALIVVLVVVVGGILIVQRHRAGADFPVERTTNAPVSKVNAASVPAPEKVAAPGKNSK